MHTPGKTKLDSRAVKHVFIGYPPDKKGYKCYNPLTKKTVVSMDVTFLENQQYFLQGEMPRSQGGNFWDVIPNPLPIVVIEGEPESECVKETSIGDRFMHPNTESDSTIGGETLQTVQKDKKQELQVYTKRKHQQKNKTTEETTQCQLDSWKLNLSRNPTQAIHLFLHLLLYL